MAAHRINLLLALAGWAVVAILLFPRLLPDPPSPVPVAGTIFFQGQPLRAGTIVLTSDPDRDDRELSAHAQLRPDGTFELHREQGPGVLPGWYRVTIFGVDGSGRGTPERYRDPARSGLLCQIAPGGPITLDFHLRP
jgi:hypothetical protein